MHLYNNAWGLVFIPDFLHNFKIFDKGLTKWRGLLSERSFLRSKMQEAKRFAAQAQSKNFSCARSLL